MMRISEVGQRRGRGAVGTYVVTRKTEPKVDMAAAGIQRRGAGSVREEEENRVSRIGRRRASRLGWVGVSRAGCWEGG